MSNEFTFLKTIKKIYPFLFLEEEKKKELQQTSS